MPWTTVSQLFPAVLAVTLLSSAIAAPTADDGATAMTELDANEAASDASDSENGMIELDANQAEEEAEPGDDETAAEDLLAEITFGEPVDCINTQRIRSTEILSDREILFRMSATEFYLNRLPIRCPRLRMSDTFSYEVRGSQLCHVDIIRVVDTFGGGISRGPACGLGKFLPVDQEQVPLVREQAKARAKAGR